MTSLPFAATAQFCIWRWPFLSRACTLIFTFSELLARHSRIHLNKQEARLIAQTRYKAHTGNVGRRQSAPGPKQRQCSVFCIWWIGPAPPPALVLYRWAVAAGPGDASHGQPVLWLHRQPIGVDLPQRSGAP